jgi:hypothetical protein
MDLLDKLYKITLFGSIFLMVAIYVFVAISLAINPSSITYTSIPAIKLAPVMIP